VPAVPAIPDSARAVLESGKLAHLVTIEPDGRPQVSIVWVGFDGDELVAGHLPEHRKVRNMRRDARVCLSVRGRSSARPRTDAADALDRDVRDVPGFEQTLKRACAVWGAEPRRPVVPGAGRAQVGAAAGAV
jgi:hypothetical protein